LGSVTVTIEAVGRAASGTARIDTESENATAITEEAGIRNNASATQIGNGAIAGRTAGTRARAKHLRN
jgi:hypothetical protein